MDQIAGPATLHTTEFAGRIALVTAAAGRGIGQAVARRLAAGGATVVVTDLHPDRTEKVAAEIAADHPATTVLGLPLDVADRSAVDAVLHEVAAALGPVRILVNNAAVNLIGSIFDYEPADWDRVVAVNLTAPWYLCRRVMPLMRDAGGGVIVNIGSYATDVGGRGIETPYATTKGGLNALTRACAHEGGPHAIRVNCVSMGMVRGTKFVDDHPELRGLPDTIGPLGEVPHATDIAETVAYLASDRARFVTGEIINVSGGAYMRT
jgi:NAD(P)-dependent dehydrogenase (short-subunit alcohol dehydrogenase family)